jgi:hypothetical protein
VPTTEPTSSTYRLRLSDIDHLVEAPPVNLLSDDPLEVLGQSGFQRMLLDYLSKSFGRGPDTLILELPPDQVGPDTEARVRTFLQRAAEMRIADNETRRTVTRREGLRSLLYGLMFLGVCLALSGLFGSGLLTFLPEFVNTIFAEGFIIVGWIALWHPVETLMFDNIPYKRANKVLRLFSTMRIEVRPWA